ncbi:uncharacterized protein PV07_02963 [Cladophialophora immunda]|uniref:Uncharacterized protein n=1 Tax=Cladophialophora immunda TaxID=569365 RepID=A0A0D1ZT80_9EURO|nr:uncharacterized protein PV07_02963 [Cladophialophora immunda]KIW31306.1 hypothetical protein PV07_02963 [Cladophialophora immunda]
MAQHAEASTIPSVKDLASSEASKRRACLNTVLAFLNEQSAASPPTPTECLQLWRGFYVGLYMHDSKNALSVQRLAAELAGTQRIMDEKDRELSRSAASSGVPDSGQDQHSHHHHDPWLDVWASAFWETVCREWASIDQWRMNKVLLLVRFFVREMFNIALGWAAPNNDESSAAAKGRIASQLQILESWPLSPRERKVPDGLRLRVLDVWVDELAGQLGAAQKAVDEAGQSDGGDGGDGGAKKAALLDTAKAFMAPVQKLSKEALSKGVKVRAKEAVQLAEEKISG